MRINPITSTESDTAAVAVLDPPSAHSSARVGLKKVSFGKLRKAADTETKTVYPVFVDDDKQSAARLARRIADRTEEFEALEGALKTDKADLRCLTSAFYFTTNQGKGVVPSSISVPYPAIMDGAEELARAGEVLVSFQNRYGVLESEAALIPILGDRLNDFFTQSFKLEIKGELLPAASTEALLAELETLFNKYNCPEALEVKEGIKPKPDYHLARHTQLTPEENFALEQVCPIVAQIKSKGRK